MFSLTNPYTGKKITEYQYFTANSIAAATHEASQAYSQWRNLSIDNRLKFIKNLIASLDKSKNMLSIRCSEEMGKPIKQATAEVEKCIKLCNYYLDNAKAFLAPTPAPSDASESYIVYEPLGVVLGVMPWNFPYWQVFRFAIPTIIAGNTVMVKHASNVAGCALLIEELFHDAGFPSGVYKNLLISGDQVEDVIKDPAVRAVSLTGSEKAGASVASAAASHIKKAVLELGGSNAFIVCADADMEKAVPIAVTARMQNTGQSCIAAKRFLVHTSVYDNFLDEFKKQVEALKAGDPMDDKTDVGPLARVDLAEEIEKQVNGSVAMGAKVLLGGKRNGAFYEPTILTDIHPDMPVFKEEVFGPVAVVMPFDHFEEAVTLSNATEFGLGVQVFTRDVDLIKQQLHLFEEGAVFLNAMVKSDPALPFGGVKKSGYGRELAENGIREFVNVKTVYIG
ncbi:succinate-semialdehyde dehydrogenase [Nostoc linckia z16]|nr:succinate-semialdehyde dehydrogenase [Nostoc linckia z16]